MQRMKEHGASGMVVESSSSSTTQVSTAAPSTGSLTASPAQSPSFEYAENLIQSGQWKLDGVCNDSYDSFTVVGVTFCIHCFSRTQGL